MRSHRRQYALLRSVGHVVLGRNVYQNFGHGWVVHMAHVLEQMMDDMVVETAKKVGHQKVVCGVIAGGLHLMFGP